MNIFATAQVKPQAKAASKKEKPVVDAPELESRVSELQELRTTLANTEARIKLLEGIVKETATAIYLDRYEQEKRRPETLKIADATGAACSFIVMDRYSKVEEEKANALKEIDPELIEETITYSFDPEMLDRYGEQISRAIMGMEIPDTDKGSLITAEKKTTVKKGAIERLYQYPDRFREIYSIINPVTQIKAK
jgi:hypothetical protein